MGESRHSTSRAFYGTDMRLLVKLGWEMVRRQWARIELRGGITARQAGEAVKSRSKVGGNRKSEARERIDQLN
jgi:hypothetical protein